MIRSETRGVARGAMPKRSRSARGPPVCIISMAQQASPNIMYQTDDLRVQLRKSSTLVVSAISGAVLMSDMLGCPPRGELRRLGFRREPLQPLEVALHPHVDEPDGQDADEERDLGEREGPLPVPDPLPEHGHHRVDEGQLDVEDHEHERDEIEADVEVDPGGAARRLAALVGGELVAARVGGAEQDAEPQHQPAQHEGEREEDEDVGELEVHRTSSGYTPFPTLSTERRKPFSTGQGNRRGRGRQPTPVLSQGESPLAPAPARPADSVARRETRVLEASPKSQQAASRRDTGSLIPRGDPLHLAPVKEQPAATTRAEPAGPQPVPPHPVEQSS